VEDFLELLDFAAVMSRTIPIESAGSNFRAGLRRRAFKVISDS
jgi:hypothetical protein